MVCASREGSAPLRFVNPGLPGPSLVAVYPMISVLCLANSIFVYGPKLPKEPGLQHEFSYPDCEFRLVQNGLQVSPSL